jgi:hypothetical protein
MTTQTNDAARGLILLLQALLETVQEAGANGAPAGAMYVALMSQWPNMTANQFNQLMGVLVKAGRVRHSGHCYYAIL